MSYRTRHTLMPRARKPALGKIEDPRLSLSEKIGRAIAKGAVPSFKKLLPQAVDLYREGNDIWMERFLTMIIESHGPLSHTGFDMACALEDEAKKRSRTVSAHLANKMLPLALDKRALSVLPFLHQQGASLAALEEEEQKIAKISLAVMTGDGYKTHVQLLCPDLFLDPFIAQTAAQRFFSDADQKGRSHRGWKWGHIDYMQRLDWHEDSPRFFGESLGYRLSVFDYWFYLDKHRADMKQTLLRMTHGKFIDIKSATRFLNGDRHLDTLAFLAEIETEYIARNTDPPSAPGITRPRARL